MCVYMYINTYCNTLQFYIFAIDIRLQTRLINLDLGSPYLQTPHYVNQRSIRVPNGGAVSEECLSCSLHVFAFRLLSGNGP
jgi:hypothetical protein